MNQRADEALVTAGLAENLTIANAYIMEGRVLYGTTKIGKPGEKIKDAGQLRVKGMDAEGYVSRGAHKLKKAFEVFPVSCAGRNCVDIGASTGGFTDIMLRNGAAKVYCVDVGYNLLDWKLRSDDRVVSMERTNARFLEKEQFADEITFGATDVSFISLKAILPAVYRVLQENADFIALIKPQFEAPKEDVGEHGVVRDASVHARVISEVVSFAEENGFSVKGLDFSPIRGPEGNVEFLLWLNKAEKKEASFDSASIDAVVDAAHKNFKMD